MPSLCGGLCWSPGGATGCPRARGVGPHSITWSLRTDLDKEKQVKEKTWHWAPLVLQSPRPPFAVGSRCKHNHRTAAVQQAVKAGDQIEKIITNFFMVSLDE